MYYMEDARGQKDLPRLPRAHGIDDRRRWSYNAAQQVDKTWEHEPPSSFRQATASSSIAVGGGFLQNGDHGDCKRTGVH
jgi:hypothetical protein